MKRAPFPAWLCLAALYASSVAAQAPTLIVKEAWMRQAPGSDIAAVYLTLHNPSTKPVVIIAVQSPLASHSMIHETTQAGGQSQMRMRERITIAPDQTLSFAPGGLHIMLSGIKQSLRAGTSVPLTLLLAEGGRVAVDALVKPITAN